MYTSIKNLLHLRDMKYVKTSPSMGALTCILYNVSAVLFRCKFRKWSTYGKSADLVALV